jgi:hypothetical protein
MSKEKVDLTLLKKLVGELEASLQSADNVLENDKNTYFVEMAKAAGLAAGLMQEASLLIMDIYAVANTNQPNASQKNDLLLNSPLLGGLKGGGFGGGAN